MSTRVTRATRSSRPFVALGLAIALSLTAGCSSDKKQDSADSTATTTSMLTDDPYCQAVRDSQNLSPPNMRKAVEMQAAAAPKELAADYAKLVAFAKFVEANAADQPAIADATKGVVEPLRRTSLFMSKNCGITPNFFGS